VLLKEKQQLSLLPEKQQLKISMDAIRNNNNLKSKSLPQEKQQLKI
jgi:hypothetical protein